MAAHNEAGYIPINGKLEYLSGGASSIVYAVDEWTVVKKYYEKDESIDTELHILKLLAGHKNIVKYLGQTDEKSILLERGQCLRFITQQMSAIPVPFDTRLCWIKDAAIGMHALHQRGIIHADIGCHNMVIIGDRLKLIDFEGCGWEGHEAASAYEWCSLKRQLTSSSPPSYDTDIFAFGCAIYEIMSGRKPHDDLTQDDYRVVQQRYNDNQYPDLDGLPFREIINGCWNNTFNSAHEILKALESMTANSKGATDDAINSVKHLAKERTIAFESLPHITNLPIEIFQILAEMIKEDDESLAPLAATCSQCQGLVEQITFRQLGVVHAELPKLSEILNNERFLALRVLNFKMSKLLQDKASNALEAEKTTVRVSAELIASHNQLFTAAMRDLLVLLSSKSNQAQDHTGIHLRLRGNNVDADPYLEPDEGVDYLDERYLKRAWVRLDETVLTPDFQATAVTAVRCNNINYRTGKIWPASWPALLAHFPRLESAYIAAFDDERKDLDGRRESRTAFGLSLRSLPPTLKNLELNYRCYPPWNQFLDPPSMLDPLTNSDVFSRELGQLASRLTVLEVHAANIGLIEFFNSISNPASLERIEFGELQAANTDGTWYFSIDPRFGQSFDERREEGRDEDAPTLAELREQVDDDFIREDEFPAIMDMSIDTFRTVMNESLFTELHVTIARAIQNMAKLKRFGVQFKTYGDGNGEHEFRAYFGTKSDYWTWPSTAGIQAGWGIEPEINALDESVRKAWTDVAEARNTSVDLLLGGGAQYRNLRVAPQRE